MKRTLLAFAILLACASAPVHAIGRLADVVVVDRNSGATLPTYYHRGDYWVAGKPGAKYAISVRNKLGERLLAVTSVDGVNVLNGDTAGWDQTGYVFSSYLQYQITGWRKSNSEVAAFEFSAASDSYAGRTGRPGHVGVIGVALFREKPPETISQAPPSFRNRGSDNERSEARANNSPLPAPAAPSLGSLSEQRADSGPGLADRAAESRTQPQGLGASSLAERQAKAAAEVMPTPKLGTAHGQRETSVVSRTSFERLQAQPNEIIRIRYDSRENLVASGVIRDPAVYPPAPGANPFPLTDEASYVPDPPVRR